MTTTPQRRFMTPLTAKVDEETMERIERATQQIESGEIERYAEPGKFRVYRNEGVTCVEVFGQ